MSNTPKAYKFERYTCTDAADGGTYQWLPELSFVEPQGPMVRKVIPLYIWPEARYIKYEETPTRLAKSTLTTAAILGQD